MEFALVAMPFFMLLFATIQVAFTIWATQNLDYALDKTARSLFTGQFQLANSGQPDPAVLLDRLKTNLCGSGILLPVFDCQNIKLDVVLSSSYANVSVPSAFDPITRNWTTSAGTLYSCPKPGVIVIVSAAAKFPGFFSFLTSPQIFVDGSQLFQSTAVFRTEPYQTSSTTGCGS